MSDSAQNRADRPTVHAYPSDVTFHDLIARNKRNTWLLIIGMAVLAMVLFQVIALLIMVYVGRSSEDGPVIGWEGFVGAAGAALLVIVLASTWSYFSGSKTLLSINGAQPLDRQADPQLYNVVEEMAIAGGIPVPKIYVMNTEALNAFATGRDPEHAAVAITTGLREKLTRDELQAVMAHELAHIRHYDIRLTLMVATLVGLIVLASDAILRTMFFAPRGRRRSGGDGKGGGAIMLILLVITILLAILAPILAAMIQFAVSRQREYLADAGAVELTRNPQGMADALRRLSADSTPLPKANRATAHMFIVNPILNAKGRENWNSAFSTHPPAAKRIERIEALLR